MKLLSAIAFLGVSLTAAAQAQPFPAVASAPAVGTLFVYNVSNTGGAANTDVKYTLTPPPNGFYTASFRANFTKQGTASRPVQDSCWLELNKKNFVQSTAVDTGSFFAGVSGQGQLKIQSGSTLNAFCGSDARKQWSYANVPLQVTLVVAAGKQQGMVTSNAMLPAGEAVNSGGHHF